MKKKYLIFILIFLLLSSCTNENIQYVDIGGKMVDVRLVESGYFLDTATMSYIQLKDAIDRIVLIEKPVPLGEIKMNDLTQISIKEDDVKEVTSKDIEAYLEQKRDRAIKYRTLKEKRGAKMGDQVVVDFVGSINGVPFEGGSATNQKIILGEGAYVKGFEEQIVGHKVADRFRIRITFPDDVENETIRGQEAVFDMTIRYIEEKYTPEVDYEFITKYTRTGATTSEAYRQEIKNDLEFRNEYERNEKIKNKLLNILLNETETTPSEIGIAWKMSKILMEQKRLAYIQGMEPIEFLESSIGDRNMIMQELKLSAKYTIKEDMILDELAKRYNITIDNDDLKKWYNDLALFNDYSKDVTYEFYKQSMGDTYVYDNARKSKILNTAIKDINITNEE